MGSVAYYSANQKIETKTLKTDSNTSTFIEEKTISEKNLDKNLNSENTNIVATNSQIK